METRPIPPKSLADAIAYVRSGGALAVFTYTRSIIINERTLAQFEKAGQWLLKEEGDGYRLRQGKSSVYLLPGQLKAIE